MARKKADRIKDSKLVFAMQFADQAANMGLRPMILAWFCELGERRARAWTAINNSGDPGKSAARMHKAESELDSLAEANGYSVEYNGLYPTFVRRADKREFHLPG